MKADTLPPWTGDDKAMLRWLDDKLDELLGERGARACAKRRAVYSEKEKLALFPWDSDEAAIAAAERGDIGPLRARYPHIESFLHLPKRRRGQGYTTNSTKAQDTRERERVALAVVEVDRIRMLWQQHYRKKNRRRDETPAERFAAKRWFGEQAEEFEGRIAETARRGLAEAMHGLPEAMQRRLEEAAGRIFPD